MKLSGDDVVVITGGGSGLGAATARSLRERGAQVVIIDLPSSPGAQVAAELGAIFAPADVRDEDQVRQAIGTATAAGTLRVAVCCAGVATPGRILGKRGLLALDDYRRVVEINLIGTFNVLRLAAEAMAANEPVDDEPTADRGLVIMTASVAAYDGQIGQAAYASSKAGVVGLTLTAARDLADHRIRVMTIAPGIVDTPMMAGLPAAAQESLSALVPHPARLARAEEYALLAGQIIDNPYLNGEVIRLDGALRMPPR